MSNSYIKVKSVAKDILPQGQALETKILTTMKIISDVVGATLGPGGHPVLIERQEYGLPNMVTKDGVTVFRNLGFNDPIMHSIMETARDSSTRTATEAGDGTSTATVLAEAIVRHINKFCKNNPKISSQKVVRKLQSFFKEVVEPMVKEQAQTMPVDLVTPIGRDRLFNVAKISANGDTELAAAVMQCFDLVGDEGNVTLTEISGPSNYEIEKIEGYPIGVGYEDSCTKFYSKFINDPGNQRVWMENPVFVLYHGRITEIQTIVFLMERIGMEWQGNGYNHNIVVVATGFSESVLAQLGANFAEVGTINVYPLLVPPSPLLNGQLDLLEDLAAVTGATIFDPINNPIPRSHEEVQLECLGSRVKAFEATRFRSTVVGHSDELLLLDRVDILKKQLQSASSLESAILNERVGKLTGGIARLKIIGASNGELREKRDRAEDAVCAIRGAIKHGCLPGGGWMLLKLIHALDVNDEIAREILIPSLMEPVWRLLHNCGYDNEEIVNIITPINQAFTDGAPPLVFDALEGKHVSGVDGGVLDSASAVLEAIRNSISVASLLGTLGACVVFYRDTEFERREASDNNSFLRTVNQEGEANRRS